MGWGFRKSAKIGGMKVNLSKSGIGVSVGTKGARVGVSSKGKAYVSGGSNGVYYRKNLGSGKSGGDNVPATGDDASVWKAAYIIFLFLAGALILMALSLKSFFMGVLSVCLGIFAINKLVKTGKRQQHYHEEGENEI
jgi:hypothetical protein